jgi:hypothetical protein
MDRPVAPRDGDHVDIIPLEVAHRLTDIVERVGRDDLTPTSHDEVEAVLQKR